MGVKKCGRSYPAHSVASCVDVDVGDGVASGVAAPGAQSPRGCKINKLIYDPNKFQTN